MFIIDDDPVALSIIERIVGSIASSVEVFDRAEPLLSRLTPSDRGCVVIDLNLPGLSGLDLHAELRANGIALPFVFVSGHADVPIAVTAMKRGAIDFLTKPVERAELIRVVRLALRLDADAAAEREARRQARERWALLSPREREVCRLAKAGMLHKQVAATLGVTVATVQAQRTSAFKKLKIGALIELIRLLDTIGEGA